MRVLVLALFTYTSPYNRDRLALTAERVEHLHVVAGDVLTTWESGAAPASDGARYALTSARPYVRRSPALMALRGVGAVVRASRPDVVHVEAEPWQALAVQAVVLARSRGLPVVVHFAENGPGLQHGLRGRVRAAVTRGVLSQVSCAVGWSEQSAAIARSLGPRGLRVATVPGTGVPDELLRYEPAASDRERWFGRPPGRPAVAFAGRLEPEKGVLDVLTVCDRVHETTPISVAVAGTGSLAGRVEQWAARRPWASFHGMVARPEVAAIYATADVVMVPSRTTRTWTEQFGKTALEAMAVGTPVVAYDSGALAALLGPSGVVVPEGDVEALARGVVQVLADPAWRQDLGRAGRVRAAAYAESELARSMVALWQQVTLSGAARG
jgi:glycosyltransferase involved in cell wall biosynthesis